MVAHLISEAAPTPDTFVHIAASLVAATAAAFLTTSRILSMECSHAESFVFFVDVVKKLKSTNEGKHHHDGRCCSEHGDRRIKQPRAGASFQIASFPHHGEEFEKCKTNDDDVVWAVKA